MKLRTCDLKSSGKLCKDNDGAVTCDKKNLPWFVVGYDKYPTHYVCFIPLPRLGDRKHATHFKKSLMITK